MKFIATLLIALTAAAHAAAAPNVQFQGVYEGQIIGGFYYSIEAIATSEVGIDRVEFYLGYYLFRVETIPPYAFNGDIDGVFFGWDTTVYPNGLYTIRAVAFDNLGEFSEAVVHIMIFNNHPPTVNCRVDHSYGCLPHTVNFTGEASDPDGQGLIFMWNFGDGAQSSLQSPTHTYNVPGVYIVRFTAVDPFPWQASDSARVCVNAGMLPVLEQNGVTVIEAENYDLWIPTASEAEWMIRTGNPGYSGTAYVQHLPDNGVLHTDNGPSVEYWIDFAATGRYYLWIRGYAVSNGASCKIGINRLSSGSYLKWYTLQTWTWLSTVSEGTPAYVDIYNPGVNILSLYGREDGLSIDKIILTQDPSFTPADTGPQPSPREIRPNDLPGDVNGSGRVDILDLIFTRNRLGGDVYIGDNRRADPNNDCRVDVLDLIYIRSRLGSQRP